MPESISHSNPSLGTVNPPSLSGISNSMDTMNSPTYLSHFPQQSLSKSPPGRPVVAGNNTPIPPVIAGNNTPVLLPSPATSSSTPALSLTPTQFEPGRQVPEEQSGSASPLSQSPFARSGGTSMPQTLQSSSPPPQAQKQPPPSPTPPPSVQKNPPDRLHISPPPLLPTRLNQPAS